MAEDLAKLATAALAGQLEGLRDAVRELAAPLTEAQFWAKPADPGNSFGHLVLHLTGNLRHRAGAELGATGYVRDREREFTETDVPAKAEALAGPDAAGAAVPGVAEGMTAERLAAPYPGGTYPNVLHGLVFVVAHFALHRG